MLNHVPQSINNIIYFSRANPVCLLPGRLADTAHTLPLLIHVTLGQWQNRVAIGIFHQSSIIDQVCHSTHDEYNPNYNLAIETRRIIKVYIFWYASCVFREKEVVQICMCPPLYALFLFVCFRLIDLLPPTVWCKRLQILEGWKISCYPNFRCISHFIPNILAYPADVVSAVSSFHLDFR